MTGSESSGNESEQAGIVELTRVLLKLSEVFHREPMTKNVYEIYYQTVRHMPPRWWAHGAAYLCRTRTTPYFPTPAEFRMACLAENPPPTPEEEVKHEQRIRNLMLRLIENKETRTAIEERRFVLQIGEHPDDL